jgi:hypothetical protein
MEVPCCGGMVSAFKTALINSGKLIPWNIVTLRIDGKKWRIKEKYLKGL